MQAKFGNAPASWTAVVLYRFLPRNLKRPPLNSGRRSFSRLFPKRQRTGAVQDLADIPIPP